MGDHRGHHHGHHPFRGNWGGGWHGRRGGWGFGFMPLLGLLFVLFFVVPFAFRVFFAVLPVLLVVGGLFFLSRFVFRSMGWQWPFENMERQARGGMGMNREAWRGMAERWSWQEEKRKRDLEGAQDAEFKPKNRPTSPNARYYVGDDGELVELPPEDARRNPGEYV